MSDRLKSPKDPFSVHENEQMPEAAVDFTAMDSVAEPKIGTATVKAAVIENPLIASLQTPDVLLQTEDVSDQSYQPALDEALDDEATMEDEEADGEADDGELDELERLGDLPLEELLRMYGGAAVTREETVPEQAVLQVEQQEIVAGPSGISTTSYPNSVLDSAKTSAKTNDDEDWTSSSDEEGNTLEDDGDKMATERSELMKFLARIGRDKTAGGGGDDSGDSSSDDEFIPVHLMMLKREVPVGPNRQVEPPKLDMHYDDATVEPTDEVLHWAPRLPEPDVVEYLKAAYIQERELIKKEIPADQLAQTDVADDEEFLKELLDCNYDKDEALRRCRRNFRPGRYESSKWSEKECEDFEAAIMENWKRFNVVQSAVPTRTVKEVVEFYYRWKKSSRYEPFIARVKLSDGKTHHNLEEKVKLRLNGKKRPFDAMDSVAEDQLAETEKEKATLEPRPKSARLDSIHSASSLGSFSTSDPEDLPTPPIPDRLLVQAGPSGI